MQYTVAWDHVTDGAWWEKKIVKQSKLRGGMYYFLRVF